MPRILGEQSIEGLTKVHSVVSYRSPLGIFGWGNLLHPGWYARIEREGCLMIAKKTLWVRASKVEVWSNVNPGRDEILGFLKSEAML